MFSFLQRKSSGPAGFSLLESMSAIGVMALLVAVAGPAVLPMRDAANVTHAAYTVAETLQYARSYAMTHNTYTWVGFYEDEPGRIILSTVASRDGSLVYDSNNVTNPPKPIDPGSLRQVGNLVKISNMNLKTAYADTADFPKGTGTSPGNAFDTRPTVSGTTAQIGDRSPAASLTPFQYPVGSGNRPAQYVFTKVIQFSPRGEVRVNNTNYSIKPIVEIGLQPARGNSANVAAVQITGLLGNVTIYRR